MTEENLTPYIPIGTLFKYLLKDYRRERQRTIHMEAQVRSLLKRNAYLEQEIGKVKQRLLKKERDYDKENLSMTLTGRPENLKEHHGINIVMAEMFLDGFKAHQSHS